MWRPGGAACRRRGRALKHQDMRASQCMHAWVHVWCRVRAPPGGCCGAEPSDMRAIQSMHDVQSMSPAWGMLRGEALLAAQRVKRFAVSALPADAAGRFAALFAERER